MTCFHALYALGAALCWGLCRIMRSRCRRDTRTQQRFLAAKGPGGRPSQTTQRQQRTIREKSAPSSLGPVRDEHAIIDAAKFNNLQKLQGLILQNPALVNCQPAGRWSALHHAAHKGNAASVRFLLEHGASTSLPNRDGLTPLELALPCVFELLLAPTLASNQAPGLSQPSTSHVCLNEETIQRLPLIEFQCSYDVPNKGGDLESNQCQICLDEFTHGDRLRGLPCAHFFHACCVDEWLRGKSSTCPTCRTAVQPSGNA
mmetsp:Transcript_23910/g.40915  ORF Transcript_23910/g.40915 Transcript_23910/m.40915 type:complete len:259 (-) Transcript_23910:361-1137(-)